MRRLTDRKTSRAHGWNSVPQNWALRSWLHRYAVYLSRLLHKGAHNCTIHARCCAYRLDMDRFDIRFAGTLFLGGVPEPDWWSTLILPAIMDMLWASIFPFDFVRLKPLLPLAGVWKSKLRSDEGRCISSVNLFGSPAYLEIHHSYKPHATKKMLW